MSASLTNTTASTTTPEDTMHENITEITVHGDGTVNTSHGTAEIIGDDERVTVTLPDRFGMSGPMIDLTHADAVRFAQAVLAAASKGGESA